MSLSYYMDVHIPRAITNGLRRKGIDVLTAQEDGTDKRTDDDILDRATELGRVLFTEDADFLVIAAFRQGKGIFFAGICYLHQRDVQIGRCIDDLEFIAIVGTSDDLANRVQYLPFS